MVQRQVIENEDVQQDPSTVHDTDTCMTQRLVIVILICQLSEGVVERIVANMTTGHCIQQGFERLSFKENWLLKPQKFKKSEEM